MVNGGTERTDVPLNVNAPRSLVELVDAEATRLARNDPEASWTRASFVRRALRFYLTHLTRKRRGSETAR